MVLKKCRSMIPKTVPNSDLQLSQAPTDPTFYLFYLQYEQIERSIFDSCSFFKCFSFFW